MFVSPAEREEYEDLARKTIVEIDNLILEEIESAQCEDLKLRLCDEMAEFLKPSPEPLIALSSPTQSPTLSTRYTTKDQRYVVTDGI